MRQLWWYLVNFSRWAQPKKKNSGFSWINQTRTDPSVIFYSKSNKYLYLACQRITTRTKTNEKWCKQIHTAPIVRRYFPSSYPIQRNTLRISSRSKRRRDESTGNYLKSKFVRHLDVMLRTLLFYSAGKSTRPPFSSKSTVAIHLTCRLQFLELELCWLKWKRKRVDVDLAVLEHMNWHTHTHIQLLPCGGNMRLVCSPQYNVRSNETADWTIETKATWENGREDNKRGE